MNPSHQPDEEFDSRPIIYRSNESSEQSFRKVVDGVLIVGIVALVALVWNMSIGIATFKQEMQDKMENMAHAITELQGRVK